MTLTITISQSRDAEEAIRDHRSGIDRLPLGVLRLLELMARKGELEE